MIVGWYGILNSMIVRRNIIAGRDWRIGDGQVAPNPGLT